MGWFERLTQPINQLLLCPPPDQLFHYTSASGVAGIMETGRIRATALQYLNDSRELVHGLELTRAIALQRRAEAGEPVIREFWSKFAESLDSVDFGLTVCSVFQMPPTCSVSGVLTVQTMEDTRSAFARRPLNPSCTMQTTDSSDASMTRPTSGR